MDSFYPFSSTTPPHSQFLKENLRFLLQIGAAVAGLVLKDEADAAVTAAMNKNLKEYANDKPTQDAWAQIQVSQSIVSFTSRMLEITMACIII